MNRQDFRSLQHCIITAIAAMPLFWGCTQQPATAQTCVVTSATTSLMGTRIRHDGTTLVQGRPFFPFGFYHVSWETTTDQLRQDIQVIAASGFNTVHASIRQPSEYGSVLEFAKKLGISVISETGTDAIATQFTNQRAVLGWNIADDVDSGNHPPDKVTAASVSVKAADPKHVTYISGYTQFLSTYYLNSADVLGMQSYPIFEGDPDEVALTYPQIKALTQGIPQGCARSPYANLQAFNWGIGKPHLAHLRAPTATEARNMTYQAIAAGAKGILYYTYYDGSWSLPRNAPELWQGLKTLVPEVNTLSPYLLNGQRTVLDTGKPNIFASLWQSGRRAVLVVINATTQTSPPVQLSFPTNISSKQSLFSDKPFQESQPTARQLLLFLNPLSVVVYQMTF